MTEPRRFYLDRNTDVTGASGTGRVADGVLWPDGTVTIRWRGEHRSTVNWDNLEDAERVHGHGGATKFVFVDPGQPRNEPRADAELISVVRQALTNAQQHCEYHGTDFGRAGVHRGLPRCDSCKQPWRVQRALDAIEQRQAPSC